MEPNKERIENIVSSEKENIIILIAGIINATGTTLYWKSDSEINIGDYAIVENKQGYDLVKVTGILYTTRENAIKFSNTKYENMKKVIQGIKKELIEVIDKLLKYFKVNREFISLNIYNNEKPFVISIKSDLYIMLDVKNEGYAISINDYHNDDFSLDEEIIVNNMDEIFDVFIKTYSKYIYK